MKTAHKAKLVAIGNSRGVRLPKELIAQAGLEDDIELTVRDGEIILANRRHPRQGWAKSFEEAATQGELELTDEDKGWLDAPLVDDLDS
jgi:antitoxin MazE